MPSPTPSTPPWWLEEGTEDCGFCHHRYWYEVEVRCVACDRPGCPECMVVERTRVETWCPDCHGSAGGSGSDRDREG